MEDIHNLLNDLNVPRSNDVGDELPLAERVGALGRMYLDQAIAAEDLAGHIIATLEILGAIVPTLEDNPVALAGVMTVIIRKDGLALWCSRNRTI